MYNHCTECDLGWWALVPISLTRRAILLERGTTAPQGRRKFEKELDAMLVDNDRLPEGRIRQLMVEIREEWITLDHWITGSPHLKRSSPSSPERMRQCAGPPHVQRQFR
jgi:hypothetical protein